MTQLRTGLRDDAARIFEDIRQLTFDGVGVTRESYSQGVNAAAAYLTDYARRHGVDVAHDGAANLVFSLPDSPDVPALWSGSHLDSLPQSGNYDGLAGVVAGLLCLVQLRKEGVRLPRPFKVIGFAGEESVWFGKGYTGSSAMWGKLSAADLALTSRGTARSLEQCLREAGADMPKILAGQPVVDRRDFAGYIELHIEQGPVMVERGWPTAIVAGIRGARRHPRVVCTGQAGHSGAVPREFRRDTVFALADLISRLDKHWGELLARGRDLVVTCGVIGTDPAEHSPTRIPGQAMFSFDVRSQSVADMDEFYALFRAECDNVARERGVAFEFDRRMDMAPAVMDAGYREVLLAISKDLQLPAEDIPSGSGHDAVIFASMGIPSAMIFIRNDKGSHNPEEAMDIDDFMAGTQLMYDALSRLP
jgi:beta-ureidopropionase / N-carbamoyl-L-amino-acid hydrolase